MKAVVFQGIGDTRLDDVSEPKLSSDRESLSLVSDY
jgi:hypothetical protein